MVIILFIIIGEYILNLVVDVLNVKRAGVELPEEFKGYYNEEKYAASQRYLKANARFRAVSLTVNVSVVVAMVMAGGFNYLDMLVRQGGYSEVVTGLLFAGVLVLCTQLLNMPFSAYRTFVIEEKFGFNRTTLKIFLLDVIKGLLVTAVVGGVVFAFIVWFFSSAGRFAWLYCWIVVMLFQLFIHFIYPVVILPLFNKFTPLEQGELRRKIEDYAAAARFKLRDIFTMDGSKRSTKSNAFFTGFGKFRRIVLFDTLIQKHTVDELVSVLAHEMGHYKKKHIMKQLVLATLTTGLMFFVLSAFIGNAGLFSAFRMEHVSVYASIIFFAFLYTPISMLTGIVSNVLSRKYEYEADAFAAVTHKKPEAMIQALKKLSVDNLSNLTPHPLKVFMEYSHPPVLERIRTLKEITI